MGIAWGRIHFAHDKLSPALGRREAVGFAAE
jgi:hypothetical protein